MLFPFAFQKNMNHLQTLVVLDKICETSRNPLKWSKHNSNRMAIIVQSGLYLINLNPVPSNTLPTLNTSLELLKNKMDEEIIEIEWLPNQHILCLTKCGKMFIQNPDDTNQKLLEIKEEKVHSFRLFENYIVTSSRSQKISVHSLNLNEGYASNFLCSIRTENLISEMMTAAIGPHLVVFVSLKNGMVIAYKMNNEKLKMAVIAESIWGDEDFLKAKNMLVVRNDFIKSRTLLLMFVKGTYVVISELDVSNPTLETISVKRQQCIQISNDSIHIMSVLEKIPGQEYLVALEHGPLFLLKIPEDIEQESDFMPIDAADDTTSMKFKVLNFENSSNGAIWTLLQTSLVSKDEARLIFMTDQDVGDLIEKFLVFDSGIFNPVVAAPGPANSKYHLIMFADLLEVLRLLLLQYHQVIASDTFLKLSCLEGKILPVHYWMATFFAANASSEIYETAIVHNNSNSNHDPHPQTWNELKKKFSFQLLKNYANDVLEIEFDYKKRQFVTDNIVDHQWTCSTCKASSASEQPYVDILLCENGCKWPRCSKTLQVCLSSILAQCEWCGAIAKPQFAKTFCVLCSGPFCTE